LELTRELLFRQDVAFGSATGGGSRWALMRDSRGLALPASGAIVAPFVDVDGDGLADVDSMGRFVDAGGAMLSVARPFRVRGEIGVPRDLGGRALRGDGTRLFEYVDVNRSMLAGVVREAGPLFDPASPTALQLARGIPAILGPDTMLRETYGATTLEYVGPNTQRGSLFDVVHALSEMMHRDTTDRALVLTEILLRDHERETADLLAGAEHMIDRGDAYPDAQLEQPNVLWDDLIDVAIEYAQDPGLIDATLRAFADPRSAQLGTVYGGLMRHRDPIVYDPADPNGTPLGFPLDERVDRGAPDVVGNESLFQRSIALIDALDGVRVCNKAGAVLRIEVFGIGVRWPLFGSYDECELFDITNVAEAYALAILGRYELEINDGLLNGLVSLIDDTRIANVDDLLEQASGIDGLTRRPTPQALNRLVYWGMDTDPATGQPNCDFCGDLFERVIDRHGNDVIDTYPGTIFAWEQPGFYEGMIPLLEVLHRPEYQYSDTGRYRFGQLITALHRHWATPDHWLTQSTSPTAPNFSYQSGGRRYEENVADGFIDGRVVARMQAINEVMDAIEVEPGRDGIRVLAELAEELIDPARNPGLTTRDGRATIPRNDGSRDLPVTPLLLVLDAMRAMDRDLAAAPDRRDSWRSARGSLASQFLGTRPLGSGHVLENQRARAIILTVLPFLRERLDEHRTRGDLEEWSRQLGPDLAELLRSPMVSGLVRFLDRVQDDPDAQGSLSRLIGYLVDEASTNDAFASTLYGGADLLMVLEDDENMIPIAHALSQALAPDALDAVAGSDPDGAIDIDGSIATDALGLTREVQRLDTRHTLRVVLSNLVSLADGEDERTPLEEILDVIGEINRVTPGAGGSFVADDYAASMEQTESFLLDERRGLERLYDVVQEREIR
nr:hypothetical protein [Myxococcota bacterium]